MKEKLMRYGISVGHLGPRRGVALVLVLAFLVLLSGLVVAFFTSVTTDMVASKTYANGVTTRQLADSAAQVVMAQIKRATSQGATIAWASQPGMIQTYGDPGGGASSNPLAFYKLYSSDEMTVKTGLATFDPAAEIANWSASPALFTDLNSPVMVDDEWHFPIIDPRSIVEGSSRLGTPLVQGFDVPDANLVLEQRKESDGTVVQQENVPMPVRWLYLLQDGSIVAPSGGGGNTATFLTSAIKPTTANPIVGRIAFWTDDETAKVNINTASEGSFWDQPRTFTSTDMGLATSQVAKDEFQRFPGHPATVSLSSVFPGLTPDEIYKIAPRVGDGGSKEGTVPNKLQKAVTLDSDRLYASVDELRFSTETDGDDNRKDSAIDKATLTRDGFFLTAQSRAPDLNLFNKPRVSIWPINKNVDRRGAFDKIAAFCTTLGGPNGVQFPYYFTREDSTSPTVDFANSQRNKDLYAYLQALTSQGIPGFSSSGFDTKFGADRDQILTEIFDYIRCVNLVDTQSGSPFTPDTGPGRGQVVPIQIGSTQGLGRFETISEASLVVFANKYDSSLNPAQPTQIGAAFLLKMHDSMQGYPGYIPNYRVHVTGLDQLAFKWGTSPTIVSFGFPQNAINDVVSSAGKYGRTWGGGVGILPPLLTKDDAAKTTTPSSIEDQGNYPFVSEFQTVPKVSKTTKYFKIIGNSQSTAKPIVVEIMDAAGDIVQTFNFVFPDTGNVPIMNGVNTNGQGFAGKISLAVSQLTGAGINPDQIISNSDVIRSIEPWTSVKSDYRLIAAKSSVASSYFQPDPNYSLVFNASASSANNTLAMAAHSLRFGDGTMQANGKRGENQVFGRLVASVQYPSGRWPDITGTATNGVFIGSTSVPGDWDNGLGEAPDGAYINKADEGSEVGKSKGGTDVAPYFSDAFDQSGATFFSPNRQVPSPVVFGSLPVGVVRGISWETLLFHPDLDGTRSGSASPQDHLLLDLFTMPVVDPYPISEPFSTAGRINLNESIAPFTYITRNTGLYAALSSTKIMAIPQADSTRYKGAAYNKGTGNANIPPTANYRYAIDVPGTIGEMSSYLKTQKRSVFLSPSEICDINLVPKPDSTNPITTITTIADFWNQNKLTGDNTREMPYAHLYPLLTTKSNSYTVHMRVQTLKKVHATSPDEWVEGKDQVAGEYRGSVLIERYIDPNDPALVQTDFAKDTTASIDTHYKFRVVAMRKFAP